MFSRSLGVAIAFGIAMFTAGERVAHADGDCPLGSVQKSDTGSTWCEPTVCDADNQCPTGSVCRPVALCVEIGTLEKDAGQRVLVRQRCGANKSCPQNTTCSDKSRCVTREQADKAGLLVPAAASSAGAASGDAPKKACGCHVPGTSGGEEPAAALGILALLGVVARRRARS